MRLVCSRLTLPHFTLSQNSNIALSQPKLESAAPRPPLPVPPRPPPSAPSATLSRVTLSSAGAATGSVDLGGLEQISGDLKVEDNGKITTFSASSLSSIGGLFTLNNVTIVSTLQFPQLSSVGGIEWKSLPALQTLIFTRGVTKAKSVIVSDTFLSSLDGIDVVLLDTMDVNNNRRLTDFTIQLGNLSTRLNIQANGQNP